MDGSAGRGREHRDGDPESEDDLRAPRHPHHPGQLGTQRGDLAWLVHIAGMYSGAGGNEQDRS